MGKQMQFELISQQDGISVGKLEGETWSGVYLSSQFLDRLAEVYGAAQIRTAAPNKAEIPDAVRNLLGILTRLLGTYGTAVQPEREAHLDAHLKEAWNALMQARSMLDNMR